MLLGIMLSIAMAVESSGDSTKPVLEALCKPVVKAGLMGHIVGPGPEKGSERIYFNFRQDGGKLFLLAVDPATDETKQFPSPAGSGAWGFIIGPDDKIYLGTHEGPEPQDSGQILVFDPQHPEKGIEVIGRPSETETYIWMFTNGLDGKLYGCTYNHAKVVSYDPKTGKMADLGMMDETQQYARTICTGADGRIYTGMGYGRANVVVYDPKTGEHKSILPDEYRRHPKQTVVSVYTGADGKVYIPDALKTDGSTADPKPVTLVVKGDGVEETASPGAHVSTTTLKDGRQVASATIDGTYDLIRPDGSKESHRFKYEGAGAGLFMVSTGPLGRIYGGTGMPCEMFWYDPVTKKSENPGNPTEVGGEIYSMLTLEGKLYICAYPGAFMSKWDPTKPWNYGRQPENNPRGFGRSGPGHNRPRTMILGPDGRIYIGSYPEYGMHGGSLGVWDPQQDKLVENYENLIKDQAIAYLVSDPETGLLFGGSAVSGGTGSAPTAREARFFAFDPKKKSVVIEDIPCPGAQNINCLVRIGRRIFGLGFGEDLFVYNIDTKEYVHRSKLGVNGVPDCSLGLWKDGNLYGLGQRVVFRLNPNTYEVTVLASQKDLTMGGFAMDDYGIYYGHRASLMRYNWQK